MAHVGEAVCGLILLWLGWGRGGWQEEGVMGKTVMGLLGGHSSTLWRGVRSWGFVALSDSIKDEACSMLVVAGDKYIILLIRTRDQWQRGDTLHKSE